MCGDSNKHHVHQRIQGSLNGKRVSRLEQFWTKALCKAMIKGACKDYNDRIQDSEFRDVAEKNRLGVQSGRVNKDLLPVHTSNGLEAIRSLEPSCFQS